MSFCGYKYRFGLYAAHSNIIHCKENIHFHNFTITLYIHASNGQHDENYEVEKRIKNWLQPFQAKNLTEIELFHNKETTLESMGDTFFEPLDLLISSLGYELVKLEIYENPIRLYSVSNKRLDSTVNHINSIPFECIPLIHIEEEDEISPKVNEALEEVAITVEPIEEVRIEERSEPVAKKEPIHKTNGIFIGVTAIMGLACFVTLALFTMYIVKVSGRYPQGSDTFCHLYRADLLLNQIKQGNWFPLYDSNWYNGVEIMRYWGPFPLYLIAGLEWIAHSSVLDAYVVFLGVLILISGCGWLLWGIRYHRVGLSVFLGLIWFYMPENMRVVIYEGNLPRGVINALLPFYFYFLWRVLVDRKKNATWKLLIVTALISLCHLGITIMLMVTVTIFVLLYSKWNHCFKWALHTLGLTNSGVLLAGWWVVPALIGGATSGTSTNQVMKNFFESAWVSLNPLIRYHGESISFYFGLSLFIICIIGIIFGTSKGKPGFLVAILLFLSTTNSVYIVLAKLPFSQFLWMIRFIPIALACAMVSFLMWKQLKRWMVILCCLLLLGDCIPSFQVIFFPKEERIADVGEELENKADSLLIKKAKEITNQRLALLDLSKYGSFAPYYIAGVGRNVQYTFGAGWEGAATATNIVSLNSATEYGWYTYLFDRALELGNDTVLIPIKNLKEKQKDIELAIEAAKISGYHLMENDGDSLLFHRDTPKQFGIITEFKEIAIGDSASGIAMIFPSFEEGSKTNINEYSYEELCNYKIIYLSGFTYDNKDKAEELLLRLSENGVQIYIDMNKISEELFGVNSQSINFTETYPGFEYNGETYTSLDFTANIDSWNTVYLYGLDHTDGYCNMTEKSLPYIGTSKNENLHFIGLNILYYLQSTRDTEILKLVQEIFGLEDSSVPTRTVVPISIQNRNNEIVIDSDYDNVNTTLSNIDIFSSNEEYRITNNLIVVDSGSTTISLAYPHIQWGMIVTVVGLCFAILILFRMHKSKEKDKNDEDES